MGKWIFLILLTTLPSACTHLERSAGSGYATSGHTSFSSSGESSSSLDRQRMPSSEDSLYGMTKITAELGINPEESLSPDNQLKIKRALQIKSLERRLVDDRERQQYYKNRPWFKDDSEQLDFLMQNGYFARQAWLKNNNVGRRPTETDPVFEDLIAAKDIALGMPGELVRRSWGPPDSVDVSGNPIYGNERWKYKRYSPSPEGYRLQSKIIYFEGGKVAGWEQIDQ